MIDWSRDLGSELAQARLNAGRPRLGATVYLLPPRLEDSEAPIEQGVVSSYCRDCPSNVWVKLPGGRYRINVPPPQLYETREAAERAWCDWRERREERRLLRAAQKARRMAGDRVERSLLKLSGLVAESATTALKHERTP